VIHYAESDDGMEWRRLGRAAIPQRHEEEATARPSVLIEDGLYRMWFCHRGSRDYRDGADSYALGYAESRDGLTWERRDEEAGLTVPRGGYDDAMQAYPNVLRHNDRLYLFYNGNGFGREGIACAIWEEQ
jgi:hypothetical protein